MIGSMTPKGVPTSAQSPIGTSRLGRSEARSGVRSDSAEVVGPQSRSLKGSDGALILKSTQAPEPQLKRTAINADDVHQDDPDEFGSQVRKLLKEKKKPVEDESAETKTKVDRPKKNLETLEREGTSRNIGQSAIQNSSSPSLVDRVRPKPDANFFVTERNEGPERVEVANTIVQQFVESMDTEVGVKPKELIQAFKALDPKDLLNEPEETMPKILNQLNLDPQKTDQAERLFVKMTQDLKQENLPPQLKVLTPDDLQKRDVLSKLERLATQFFLNDRRVPYSAEEIPNASSQAMTADSVAPSSRMGVDGQGEGADDGDDGDDGKFAALSGAKASGISSAGDGTASASSISKFSYTPNSLNSSATSDVAASKTATSQLKSLPMGDDISEMDVTAQADGPQAQEDMTERLLKSLRSQLTPVSTGGPTANTGGPVAATPAASAKDVATSSAAPLAGLAALARGRDSDSKGSKDSGGEDHGADATAGTPTPGGHGAQVQNANGKFAAVLAEAGDKNQDVQSANLKEVTEQTQGLSRKGGGEMNVKLSPEGMGDLNLKVSIHDGKVHVQMLADSPEAKKMLESNVHELKKSLEHQNILVDTIKVDFSNNARLDGGNKDSAQSEMSRNMAQEFLGNFRDQNEGFRQGFFEAPTLRAYRTPVNRAKDLPPEALNVSNKARSANNRRLDLVA